MSRLASIWGVIAIVGVVLLAALAMAFQQRYYWELLELQASGATYVGMQISMYEQPSIEQALRAAAPFAFPNTIPAILKLATLLAGAALIVTMRRQLAAMRAFLAGSTSRSKGQAGA